MIDDLRRLAVLLRLGELALDLLERHGGGARRRELQLERARRLDLALGEPRRVPHLAGDRHLHLERPLGALLPVLLGAGVAQRRDDRALAAGRQPVHHRLAGAELVALVGELDPLERLAVELVLGVHGLGVLDGHRPVAVVDDQLQGEVVGDRRRRRRQVEPRQGGVVDDEGGLADEAERGDEHREEEGAKDDAAHDEPVPTVVAAGAAALVAHCRRRRRERALAGIVAGGESWLGWPAWEKKGGRAASNTTTDEVNVIDGVLAYTREKKGARLHGKPCELYTIMLRASKNMTSTLFGVNVRK